MCKYTTLYLPQDNTEFVSQPMRLWHRQRTLNEELEGGCDGSCWRPTDVGAHGREIYWGWKKKIGQKKEAGADGEEIERGSYRSDTFTNRYALITSHAPPLYCIISNRNSWVTLMQRMSDEASGCMTDGKRQSHISPERLPVVPLVWFCGPVRVFVFKNWRRWVSRHETEILTHRLTHASWSPAD